jgi:hypothetical protein
MQRIDNGINCYTCKNFEWIHYTSKFIDFCNFFEEALPTNTIQDDLIKCGMKLLICKKFELHKKFNHANYANLISQSESFEEIKKTLEENILYTYMLESFHLCQLSEFEK